MLIATDLDGTLLTPEGTISPRTRDAIRAAERVGVPVVPVTARQIYGIEKWRDDLGAVFQRRDLLGSPGPHGALPPADVGCRGE